MKKSFLLGLFILAIMLSRPLLAQEQETEAQPEENKTTSKKVLQYHDDGAKKVEGQLIDNKRDGVWTEWYEDGTKKSEKEYKEGKRNGLWKEWYDNGSPKSDSEYQDDKRSGRRIEWYYSGQKKLRQRYRDGIPEGVRTEWDEYGNTTRTIGYYANGDQKYEIQYEYTREGTLKTQTEWFENGNKRVEVRMKNDIKDGDYKEWFEDGVLSIETQFKEGKEDGLHRDYYQDGSLRMEIEMTAGKKNGLCTLWNQEGLKQWIKVYQDGQYVRSLNIYQQDLP